MFHRSERLLFRPGWIEDAPELVARVAQEEIVGNFVDAPWPCREADARAWLARPELVRHPRFLLTLPHDRGSTIVGGCAIRPATGGAEVDFWIARDWRGQGLATEAVRALKRVARPLGHALLRAFPPFDNPAAVRVITKAGFGPTGAVRQRASGGRAGGVLARAFEAVLAGRDEAAVPADPAMPFAA